MKTDDVREFLEKSLEIINENDALRSEIALLRKIIAIMIKGAYAPGTEAVIVTAQELRDVDKTTKIVAHYDQCTPMTEGGYTFREMEISLCEDWEARL